jgi:hypothetical protein
MTMGAMASLRPPLHRLMTTQQQQQQQQQQWGMSMATLTPRHSSRVQVEAQPSHN